MKFAVSSNSLVHSSSAVSPTAYCIPPRQNTDSLTMCKLLSCCLLPSSAAALSFCAVSDLICQATVLQRTCFLTCHYDIMDSIVWRAAVPTGFGLCRLRLGLWEAPKAAAEGELDVRPRWPLTDRRDSRSMPATKSMRKSRIFTSLTELTAEALGNHPVAATASL